MKRVGVLFLFLFLLSGCSHAPEEMERGLALRSSILQAETCRFSSRITADYGDKIVEFAMDCCGHENGDLQFTVTEPESISQITGTISENGGKLTFDGLALCFEKMADEQLSPVSAPWIFWQTLRSGYMTSAGMEGDWLRLTIDDSYEDDALHLDIWLSDDNMPARAEILHDGSRILSLQIENFVIS